MVAATAVCTIHPIPNANKIAVPSSTQRLLIAAAHHHGEHDEEPEAIGAGGSATLVKHDKQD